MAVRKKQIVRNRETGEEFPTIKAAADSVGVSCKAVSNVLNGYCKSAGGVEWRDADGE